MKQKCNDYKESGYEWLGEIPLHWELKKAKWGFKEKSIKGYPNEVLLSVSKGKGVIPRDELENKAVMAFKDLQNFKLVVSKDFVIHLRSFQSGFEMSSNQGIVSPAYTVFSCENSLDPNYYKYLFYMRSFIDAIAATTQSLRDGKPIAYKDFSNMELPFPTIEEQTKIASFLDFKLNEIDNLINMKNKFITLLEQQRQSIITEAVTKGLNSNVKMKNSGVEWIGEIPEHWDLKRLKYALLLNPSKNEVSNIENIDVTFLPMEKIIAPNEVDISLKKKIEEVYNGYTYFKDNDLVLAKVTPCFENGNIAVMQNMENGIGFGTTELHVLRPRTNQNISFYYYLAQSGPFKQQGVSTMYGVGGLKRIPNEFVLNYEFGMPPLAEQNEIVDFLNYKCREIQSTKHLIKLQIVKLKEYRQSLIYEAVTGKIDESDMEID